VRGPVNVVAPGPVKNADFTRELARAVRRPAFLPAPAWALRFVLGKGMADEALLGSTRAEPRVLERTGYAFRHPTLAAALQG
jgi:NAD dependent epimerase/dehydratase family enzyme